jgi:L-phenylalanine/L-methionine N-acetyltransferase
MEQGLMDCIRPLEPEDYGEAHALCTDPEVARWLGGSPFESPEAWRKRLLEPDPYRSHTLGAFDGERMLGMVQLEILPWLRMAHTAKLWIAVCPAAQGAGLGTRLLARMVEIADRWMGLVRLEASIHADNARSLALFGKLGFETELRLRQDMFRDGELVDGVVVGRLRPGFSQDPGSLRAAPAMPPRRDPPGPIEVRPFRDEDARLIRELHLEDPVLWGTLQVPTATVAHWRKRLVNPPQAVNLTLAVAVGGVGVATGGLFGNPNPRQRHALMLGMGVSSEYQGMGVGTRLLQALLDADEKWFGARRIELDVYTDNVRARRLYERNGFVVEGIRRAYAWRDGGFVDACKMARTR